MEDSMRKDLKQVFASLEEQGWTIREAKKGWMAVPPDESKPIVTIHGTPSDKRAWNNMMAALRRSGFLG
jgi:hypothetical protein